ncbi:MAG TPA: hypothetical protein VM120_13140 [Bryobacteraceae bacterium]|nr:hypothetical protein [Bryobacteraceae bacterium]
MLARILFPFALLAMCLPLLADPPMTALRIEVKTLKDKPVERASVILDFLEGRSIAKLGRKVRTHWETRTNQEGVAKLPPVPQGKIRVQVIAKGYQTAGQVYEITEEEKTIEIKLNPPQSQYSVHQ